MPGSISFVPASVLALSGAKLHPRRRPNPLAPSGAKDALSPLTVGAILISVCDPKLREGDPRYFDQDYAWKVS